MENNLQRLGEFRQLKKEILSSSEPPTHLTNALPSSLAGRMNSALNNP